MADPRWRYRWTLLAACVLAYFATRVGQVAIGALVPEITESFSTSASAIGAALTGMWIAYALAQVPSGALCDKVGERRVVLLAVAVAGVGALVLAAAPTVGVFGVAVVALGAGVGLYYTAGTVLVTSEAENPAGAIGLHRLGGELAGIVAPVGAVGVAAWFGWRGALFACALVTLPVLSLVVLRVRPTPQATDGPGTENERFDRRTVLAVLGRPTLLSATAVASLAEFVAIATITFLPALLIGIHGVSAGVAGALLTTYFAAVALSQPVAGRLSDRFAWDAVTACVLLVGAVGYGLIALSPGPGWLVVAVVLSGVAMGWNGPVQAHVLATLPESERGAGFGLVRTTYILLGALGGVVTGIVADGAGWAVATWLLAATLLVAVPVVLSGRVGEPISPRGR
jgi:MFS transporter, YNFM family, putative membrane transport protein